MKEDISGKKFGFLTAIRPYTVKGKNTVWECRCECGKIVTRRRDSFINSNNASCGCKRGIYISKGLKGKVKQNDYDLTGEYGKCFIGNTFFIFDLEDFEIIKDYRWFYSQGYPSSWNKQNGKILRFHRFIMNCPDGMVVDHINHNKTDNRKTNLRICTSSENNKNIKIRTNNKSGYPGVSTNKSGKKWVARIGCDNQDFYLGTFDNKEDAIKAKKEAEEKLFGEYAYKEDSK